VSRTGPAEQLTGIADLFIVTDEQEDDAGTTHRMARLLRTTHIEGGSSLGRPRETFEFYDGRDPRLFDANEQVEVHSILA